MSMSWKTTLDEIPQELGSKTFEDWLWKRWHETAGPVEICWI
jgi:hypothetical protein